METPFMTLLASHIWDMLVSIGETGISVRAAESTFWLNGEPYVRLRYTWDTRENRVHIEAGACPNEGRYPIIGGSLPMMWTQRDDRMIPANRSDVEYIVRCINEELANKG